MMQCYNATMLQCCNAKIVMHEIEDSAELMREIEDSAELMNES
jgi:hypothetical protein